MIRKFFQPPLSFVVFAIMFVLVFINPERLTTRTPDRTLPEIPVAVRPASPDKPLARPALKKRIATAAKKTSRMVTEIIKNEIAGPAEESKKDLPDPVADPSVTEITRSSVSFTIHVPPAIEKQEAQANLSPRVLSGVFKSHMKTLARCADQYTKGGPKTASSLDVTLLIGSTGRVAQSEVSLPVSLDSDVVACVTQEMSHWIFPDPKGPSATVRYSVVFE